MSAVELKGWEGSFPAGLLSPSDIMMLRNVRSFVEAEVLPRRRDLEASTRSGGRDYEDMLARMVPLGLQGCTLPEERGGGGVSSALTLAALAEELGRGDASLGWAALCGEAALRPAVRAGNVEVLERLAPPLCGDAPFTGALALFEESGCSGLEESGQWYPALGTRAAPADGRWELNGRKDRVTNSMRAGFFCVAAAAEEGEGEGGIGLFYLIPPLEGLAGAGERDMGGLRGAQLGDIELKGVRVPSAFRAAGPEEDTALLEDAQALARLLAAALAVGAGWGALHEALEFSAERPAAGKPIRQHSVCAAILADAASSLQAARDCYASAAAFLDRNTAEDAPGHQALARASLAKLFCCRAAVEATNRCMELMGSYGYVSDYHIEKYWRDAKLLQLMEGGTYAARLDGARWLYPFDPLFPNPLYEEMAGEGA